jgi:DNA-binding MarR family transcriptional regulator
MSAQTPVAFQVLNEIGIINQLAGTLLERRLPDGLRLAHFGVLNHFVRLGGEQSPLSLARAFQVTKGAMTNTLQRLETRGCITVRPDPRDGRAKLVSITDEGRRLHQAAIEGVAPLIAEMQKALPESRFAEALPFLRALRAYLDAKRDRR